MRELPHLHVLLDMVETMLMEQQTKPEDRDRLQDQLYQPDLTEIRLNGGDWVAPPGFDPDSIEDGFDALLAQES